MSRTLSHVHRKARSFSSCRCIACFHRRDECHEAMSPSFSFWRPEAITNKARIWLMAILIFLLPLAGSGQNCEQTTPPTGGLDPSRIFLFTYAYVTLSGRQEISSDAERWRRRAGLAILVTRDSIRSEARLDWICKPSYSMHQPLGGAHAPNYSFFGVRRAFGEMGHTVALCVRHMRP